MGHLHGLERGATLSAAQATNHEQWRGWPCFRAALLSSISLSLLFIVCYSGTNHLTALRSDVGVWVYAWERLIPFVPIFIIPYMSIDLFFVAAPFLCSSRVELRTFSRRIALAILAACLCFLIMPLKLDGPRPEADGWLGAIFHWFRGMDLPYNLFPSLHITLRTILADTYARHTRGATRLLSHIWFSLIGFSTLFTCQHHVIDIVGGFALAAICFYAIRETPWRSATPNPRNQRVGVRYAAGAVLLALVAIAIGRDYGWPLWWPAICFGLVSAAYSGLGPAVYGKRDGRLPLSSRLLLLPMLLGQHASLRHYARRSDAWNQVLPNLWLGRHLSRQEAVTALTAGVTAVIDLTSEFSRPAPFHSVPTLFLPVLDLTAPTPAQIRQAVDFFQSHGTTGVVYIHCKVGYSRSAAIAGACLLSNGHGRSATDVIAHLRRVRPNIVIRPEAESALEAFAKSRILA